MTQRRNRAARRLLTGGALAAGLLAATTASAQAAVTASFANGALTVTGDSLDNNVAVSRNAAGQILVNGGAVAVIGGTPTVANTSLIKVFGLGGNDVITLSEVNGALPKAQPVRRRRQRRADRRLGRRPAVRRGRQRHAARQGRLRLPVRRQRQRHADRRRRRRPGLRPDRQRPHDLEPGRRHRPQRGRRRHRHGRGQRRQRRSSSSRPRPTARACASTALNPAPFSIDIGTSENLVLNANGGDDSFSATGNLAALIKITVDGGTGNDNLLGSNGVDILLGGDGNDFIDGQQGNDVGFLGAGDDTFQWDPGDGNDVVEGQDGADTMLFNGSGANERMETSANGGRVRFTRDIANIVMDLDDVETINAKALGGADTLTVNDVSGTDLTRVIADLGAVGGGNDAAADNVIVNATNGDDVATVAGSGTTAQVLGLAAQVSDPGRVRRQRPRDGQRAGRRRRRRRVRPGGQRAAADRQRR